MRALTTFSLMILAATTSRAYEVDLDKLQAFVKKENNCHVAVFEVVRDKRVRKRISRTPQFANCIGDVVTGKGTINEKAGCAAFTWNLDSGTIDNLTAFGPNMSSKMCDAGGVEEVLKELLYRDPKGKKILVQDRFEFPAETAAVARSLLFTKKDEYRVLLGYPKDRVDLNSVDVSKPERRR